MRGRIPYTMLTAFLVVPLACEGLGGGEAPEPFATEDQKTLYALGLGLARKLELFHLSEAEFEIVAQGLADGALRREARVSLEGQNDRIQALAQARQRVVAEEEQNLSAGFVEQAAAEPGAETLPSGIVLNTRDAGTGESPGATDGVRVHYHGTLRDGTVFDSTRERDRPAEFRLDRVIPCWTEALQRMRVGGKAIVTCPAAQAYRDRGVPPKIKPGAALRFEVELLGVERMPERAAAPR